MVTEEKGVAGEAQPAPPRGLLRLLSMAPPALYRLGLGRIYGRRFLEVVHFGHRTGERRETVLAVLRYDPVDHESVVVAGSGPSTEWLHDVEAGLAQEIRAGGERYRPAWRELPVDEAAEVLTAYLQDHRLTRPVARRVLSGLLGSSFDGSPDSIQLAVRRLPMIGFKPDAASTFITAGSVRNGAALWHDDRR